MALTQWQLKPVATDTIASGDFIPFSDEGESGDPINKLTVDNLAAFFAGTSLTASSSVISVDDDFLRNDANDTTSGVVTAAGFTVGSMVLTDGVVTDTSGLSVAAATTVTGALTVGVDDTGHDVKFFGASAGAYMEYDQSADQLRIMGASADAVTSTGKLLLATSLTDINANDVIGKIDFQTPHEAGGTDAITVAASIQAIAQGTFSASVNATDLIFYTGHSEAATEKFRVTSQGELGIGGANYGTDGQVFTSAGAGAAPAWEDAGGGGLEYVTQYRLSAAHASGYITANWEVPDTAGYETLGTAVGESSGVFSFPDTGYWYITFVGRAHDTDGGGLGSCTTKIETSVDSGSNYVLAAYAANGHAYYQSAVTNATTFLFKVTNVSSHLVKLKVDTSDAISGSTSASITHVTFTKLAGV